MFPEASNLSEILMLASCVLSLAALFYLFQKHIGGNPLLVYQPRRRVPWGPLVALFAASLPLLNIVFFFFGTTETPAEEFSTQELLVKGWTNFAFMMLFVPGIMVWLVAFFRADAHDLGLPTSGKQLSADIGLGVFATIASLLPIYAVQLTLVTVFESTTPHPLVEQLQKHQSPQMLLLGFLMAVVAAPLFEEFLFRQLLQGWLERHEDERLSSPLPHGWAPILISALIFGLAHLGHGVAPIPLVLFGIVLGYLYQRTHRLAPSIAAHMTFNAYSMLLLWLQLETGSPQ